MQNYTLVKAVILLGTMTFMVNSHAMRGGGDRSVDVQRDNNGQEQSFNASENTSRSLEADGHGVEVNKSTTYTGPNGEVTTTTTTPVVAPAARYRYDQDQREYEEGYQ